MGIGKRRVASRFLTILLVAHCLTSLVARPYYFAYFNSLAGGSDQAYKLFVDSSLDWGQYLPGLADYFDRQEPSVPTFLSYFGTGEPSHEGIRATRFGDAYFERRARSVPAALTGGTYAISATMLQRVYSPTRGPWTPSFEATYAQLQS